MSDLLIVFIGLALMLYIFFVLATARTAIEKGLNGLLWFFLSLIIPPIAFALVLIAKTKKAKNKEEYDFADNIIMELTQPFVDLAHTSRALLGVNLSYVLEGLTYFGVVGLLAIFFNDYIELNDIDANLMVGILTGGITIAMLFFGATVDWIGLRKSLLIALSLMLVGRIFLTISPEIGIPGLWNSAHIFAMLGIFGIILGYGIYQPACYAGVKQLTNEKTAAMGYAMLYALMNLGGFLPGIISPPVRRAFGITGVFWVYAALTVVGIGIVYFIITKKAMKKALSDANKDADGNQKEEEKDEMAGLSKKEKFKYYIKNFPLKDLRFLYFVFILIFVQTLFAHNWLTIPQYTVVLFRDKATLEYQILLKIILNFL